MPASFESIIDLVEQLRDSSLHLAGDIAAKKHEGSNDEEEGQRMVLVVSRLHLLSDILAGIVVCGRNQNSAAMQILGRSAWEVALQTISAASLTFEQALAQLQAEIGRAHV